MKQRPLPAAYRLLPTCLPTAYCLLAVGLVALAVRLAFHFRAPPFITNDSLSYLLPGFDVARGLEFAPILKRPPLYPAFIGGVIAAFGEEPRVLMLIQHLLGVLTVLGAFLIGLLIFGRAGALLAGLLTALSGPLVVTEHYLMSETLFGVLLVTGLLVFLIGVRRAGTPAFRTLGWFAAAGVLLGLAALTRPIAQLVVVLLAASLPFLWRWPGALGARRAPLRTILLPAVALLGCFAIAVIPWMARNLAVQGTFAIAGGSGEGLAVRTIRYEQQFDFREPPGGDGDRVLSRARRIYRDEAEEGSAFELAGRLRDELEVSEVEADNLMRRIALDAIARRPIYYLQGTAEMFASTFVGRPIRLRQDWEPWRNIAWEERVEHLLPEPTPAEDRSFPVAEMLVSLYDPARLAAPIAILFAIGALAGLMPSRRPALLLAILVLGLLLTGAALIGIEWRYRYPLDPLINVLVAGGVVASARWAVGLAPWTRRARAQHQGAAS